MAGYNSQIDLPNYQQDIRYIVSSSQNIESLARQIGWLSENVEQSYSKLLQDIATIFEQSKQRTKLKRQTIPLFQDCYDLMCYLPTALKDICSRAHYLTQIKLQHYNETIQRLRRERNDARLKMQEYQMEVSDTESRTTGRYQAQLEQKPLLLYGKHSFIEDLEAKNEQLQVQLKKCKELIKSLRKEASEKTEALDTKGTAVRHLEAKILHKHQELVEAKSENGRLKTEMIKLQNMKSRTQPKFGQVGQLLHEEHIANREKELLVSQLKKQILELQRANEFQNTELKRLNSTSNIQVDEIERLKHELAEKNEKLIIVKDDIRTTGTQFTQAQMKLNNLEQDLKSKESECQSLQHEIHRKDKKHAEVIAQKDEDLQQLQIRLSHLDGLQEGDKSSGFIGKFSKSKKQLKEELSLKINECHKLNDQMYGKDGTVYQLQQQVKSKDDKIKELSEKLAAEMSVKVSADESQVENVSIKNRPMNISEEYQLICSNQWLGAKVVIDDLSRENTPEYMKIQLLCQIMLISEQSAHDILAFINESLEMQLHEPIRFAFTGHKIPSIQPERSALVQGTSEATTNSHISKEMTNLYGDILRNTSEKCSVDLLVQHVAKFLISKSANPSLAYMEGIWNRAKEVDLMKQYLSSVARLCWKMAIQRPQMEFHLSDKWKGDKFQEMFWKSENVPNAKIFHVYPMLYHGQSLMAKGKVMLVDPRKIGQ